MSTVFRRYCHSPIKRMANDPIVLVLAIAGTILVGAVAFMLFEGVGMVDGIYWTTTTMTSVGYGDLLATSAGAKLFTAAFQLWSLFVLVPCAIANIIDAVRVDPHQMSHDEQEWLFEAVASIADAHDIGLPPQPKDYEA